MVNNEDQEGSFKLYETINFHRFKGNLIHSDRFTEFEQKHSKFHMSYSIPCF